SELTSDENFSLVSAKNSAWCFSGMPSKVASDARCSPLPRAISSFTRAKLSEVKDLAFCSGFGCEEEFGDVLEVKSDEDSVGSVVSEHVPNNIPPTTAIRVK